MKHTSVTKSKTHTRSWEQIRARIFRMVSVGVVDDRINTGYDVISIVALAANIIVSIMNTYDGLHESYGTMLTVIEQITVFFFGIDYVLRLLTAPDLYPDRTPAKATFRYVFSATGIIDLLSFLPYYLPVFFPDGVTVFRMFRVIRILRLFRINAYYDSLNVITEVISSKKQQLLSSVFIIMTLMLGSSLCMYSLEHEAQPDVFTNAFSGVWWAVSTLLTVGYGDIYPITPMGKAFGIVISFLGVGMVAIPTGIISAGFVEQYTRLQKIGEYGLEQSVRFIKIQLDPKDSWVGKEIRRLELPHGALIAVIQRGRDTIVPRGDVILKAGDKLVLGAEPLRGDQPIELTEIELQKNNPWNGLAINELDISRQSFIVMVKRHDHVMIPKGSLVLHQGDVVYMYTKKRLGAEG